VSSYKVYVLRLILATQTSYVPEEMYSRFKLELEK